MSTIDNVSAEIEMKVSIKSNVPGLKKYLEDLFGAIKGAFVVPDFMPPANDVNPPATDVPVPDLKEMLSDSKRKYEVKEKICASCGKKYIPTGGRQKRCEDCRLKNNDNVVKASAEKTIYTKTCQRCGKKFTTTIAGRNYCHSRTCLQSENKIIEVKSPTIESKVPYVHKCVSCGRIFYTQYPETDRKLCNDHCTPR